MLAIAPAAAPLRSARPRASAPIGGRVGAYRAVERQQTLAPGGMRPFSLGSRRGVTARSARGAVASNVARAAAFSGDQRGWRFRRIAPVSGDVDRIERALAVSSTRVRRRAAAARSDATNGDGTLRLWTPSVSNVRRVQRACFAFLRRVCCRAAHAYIRRGCAALRGCGSGSGNGSGSSTCPGSGSGCSFSCICVCSGAGARTCVHRCQRRCRERDRGSRRRESPLKLPLERRIWNAKVVTRRLHRQRIGRFTRQRRAVRIASFASDVALLLARAR